MCNVLQLCVVGHIGIVLDFHVRAIGQRSSIFLEDEQTFDPPGCEKSQQLQIQFLPWWVSLFNLSLSD